ncbi:hypothetical protein ZOSMA_2G01710 [Zostera marina]|uniref:Uncharacterized protein n=1 Tax=Zostera marina TaxID=29655 RepID=A0A0K9PD85_ZOSMR|nr:hypothetical protein ZOSMA_2G01710 [Zostera marina]
MGEPSSSDKKEDTLLPEDPEQRKMVISIIESLRTHCLDDIGGLLWDFDDIVRFVNRIKVVYEKDSRGYLLFLHILSKVPKNEASLIDVFQQVKILFRYDPYLLEEFMCYLPSSMAMKPSRGANELTKEDALSYVKTVKQTLHNDGKYEEFLKLMDDCRTSSINPSMLMSKAQDIFQEHQHLINGLSLFMRRR